MAGGVLVVGSMNMDIVVVAPRIPAPNEYLHARGFKMVIGGKGANQALASHRLGNPTRLLARVGADDLGTLLIEKLLGDGVSASLIKRTPGATTGVALIVVEEGTGANTIVVDPGANRSLEVADLDALDDCYDGVGTALFQLEIPVEVSREASRRARERGVLSILDSGPARRADISAVGDFDVVSPNEPELSALTGIPVSDAATAVEAAAVLIDAGVGMVAVKMGGSGAVLVDRDEAWHVPPYRVTCVDSTGAGDAFTAGLGSALGAGMEPVKAVEFANAAGAVAVTAVGTEPSMPTRAQVEELMGSQAVEVEAL